MLQASLRAAVVKDPDGSVLDVVMLQLHVLAAGAWTLLALLVALVAVPMLRRIPSALGLHVLQIKRRELALALWGSYGAVLASGTYLLITHTIYEPPLSGSDWTELESQSYGVPYYYALYAKIGMFLLMGLATILLSREALRAAAASEEAGGPEEFDLDDDDSEWLEADEDYEIELIDSSTELQSSGVGVIARRRAQAAALPDVGLWGAVGVLVVGLGGIGLCVTLIKYFHELSEAAVVYEQLRGRG